MSNTQDTKRPPLEKPEPQQITPQTDELDDRQLDDTSGGGTGTVTYVPPPPHIGPIGP